MAEQYIQVTRSLLVSSTLISMGGKVSICSQTVLLAIVVGLESAYSWLAPGQMARILTFLHVKTVISGAEEPSCVW